MLPLVGPSVRPGRAVGQLHPVWDMSDRMSIAAGLGPVQEIYSIDESFRGFMGFAVTLPRDRAPFATGSLDFVPAAGIIGTMIGLQNAMRGSRT